MDDESALRALAAAQATLTAADALCEKLNEQRRQALAAQAAARQARVAALRVATADGTRQMAAAAAVMDLSVSRVYQLTRDYPSQKGTESTP